ncbi:lipoyl(octanoyl) transferase LipB [Myxococcota bacterium]|nr:lipoyl(octanoyl) transferase LipB [Myxococcota bacterium]MCZ7619552.1 lipoyl(octanoyl) transferase LipB [Myxococcota bacterium]
MSTGPLAAGPGGATALAVEWLGLVPYPEALAIQERRIEARRCGTVPDGLLLLEHPPVITLGRRGRAENVLASPATLAARGVAVHRVGRGGDATLHAPGQLVGYLIVDLAARGEADAGAWLRRIETILIAALRDLGLEGYTRPGQTGVFVTPAAPGPARKVASIGVGLRGWISWHGFALNVTLDPAQFDLIVPCGLRDVAMTSLRHELGAAAPSDLDARVRAAVAARCVEAFR